MHLFFKEYSLICEKVNAEMMFLKICGMMLG